MSVVNNSNNSEVFGHQDKPLNNSVVPGEKEKHLDCHCDNSNNSEASIDDRSMDSYGDMKNLKTIGAENKSVDDSEDTAPNSEHVVEKDKCLGHVAGHGEQGKLSNCCHNKNNNVEALVEFTLFDDRSSYSNKTETFTDEGQSVDCCGIKGDNNTGVSVVAGPSEFGQSKSSDLVAPVQSNTSDCRDSAPIKRTPSRSHSLSHVDSQLCSIDEDGVLDSSTGILSVEYDMELNTVCVELPPCDCDDCMFPETEVTEPRKGKKILKRVNVGLASAERSEK